MRAALLLLALPGCWLEKVTGEPVPLDPAFYEAVEASQGAPGVGGGSAVPFSSHEGETVMVRGTITGELEDPSTSTCAPPTPPRRAA